MKGKNKNQMGPLRENVRKIGYFHETVTQIGIRLLKNNSE